MAKVWRGLPWLLLLIALADWLGLKTGVLSHPPRILAFIAALLILVLLVRLGSLVLSLRPGQPHRGRTVAGLLLTGGLLVTLGAGWVNWAFGLQGFVVLTEGQTVPLHQGSHLQEFHPGPLASVEEMEVVLTLGKVELVSLGGNRFSPTSHIRVGRRGEEPVWLDVRSGSIAEDDVLRFHQGAFGFAPRVVITHGERTLFDRVVPFTTRRQGAEGIAFDGHFTVEKEALEVRGSVTLPEGLDGHASLALSLARGGTVLGRGTLLPGHFAELPDDYRLGFAGLKKWSEIDVSRRSYSDAVLAGAGLALLGGLSWPLARWRGW